jgi:hypothetical protein
MPILLKKIDGSVLSLFGPDNTDFTGDVILIRSVVGEVGLEDYIDLTVLEGFTQDFSSVIDAEFCETTPVTFGPNSCPVYTDITISY